MSERDQRKIIKAYKIFLVKAAMSEIEMVQIENLKVK